MQSPEAKEHAKKEAEALKSTGNTLFGKQKYKAAIDAYTQAVLLNPSIPAIYVNRALCHKRLGDMEAVARDSAYALELDKDSLKANFLLGAALRQNGGSLVQAAKHLWKALESARQQGDSIKDEIWAELAACNYAIWQHEAAIRRAQTDQLRNQLDEWLSQCPKDSPQAHESSYAKSREAWDLLFERAQQGDTPRESPSAFQCPLTMSLFREPVITPAGNSYERAALLQHIQRGGQFDPIARDVKVTPDNIVTNVGLRNAVAAYLEEHPYAWDECR